MVSLDANSSRGGRCGSEDYLYAGTHIFRRHRITQLIKCTPWSTRLCLHPTIIKKMKTFLEVEGKMGPIPTPGSQFRPPLPDTNPNIRKDTVTEKRKRATPKKNFRPAMPSLPQCTHPCQRPHQNLRAMCPYFSTNMRKYPMDRHR